MESKFGRFAVYWLPDGALGKAGAGWLGWDARTGAQVAGAGPDTDAPRRYGFHATIVPPMRLTPGADAAGLAAALRDLAAALAPARLGRLHLRRAGRYLALLPDRNPSDLAARAVMATHPFRAPQSGAELTRRRAAGLTPAQDALLLRWGYPHVMEAFAMHLTLTGRDPSPATEAAARARLDPVLAGDHTLDTLSLMGEDERGRFHLIEDIPLPGHDAATA